MYTRPTISSIDYVRDEVVKTVLMHRRTQHCVGSDTPAPFYDLDVCVLGERSLNLVFLAAKSIASRGMSNLVRFMRQV